MLKTKNKACLERAGTHQNTAHWGNLLTGLLSVYTQSGSGVPIHSKGHLLVEKNDQKIQNKEKTVNI